jgi:phage baseplate assembly protein W
MATITPLSRRKETYSDFFKDMTQSLVNADLARKVDENSVKESVRNIVLTNRGERLFQPEIGCDIRQLLFENISTDTIIIAKEIIRTAIENYEPRCSIIGIDILASLDSNNIGVVITFNIINREEPIVLTITLDRVR